MTSSHTTQQALPLPPAAPALRAISVRQPWAGLLVLGVKRVENRTWTTKHRGLLLIHASKKAEPLVVWRVAARECRRLGLEKVALELTLGVGLFIRLSPVIVVDGDHEVHSFAFDGSGCVADWLEAEGVRAARLALARIVEEVERDG